MIFQLQDDMKSLKRDVAIICMDKNERELRMKDYHIYLNSKDKYVIEGLTETRQDDSDN